MARGGKRKGSGRKPGLASVLAEKTRDYIAGEIDRNIKPMTAALVKKSKKGDVFAFKELMDRAHGRAHQSMDMTSAGKPLPKPIMEIQNVSRNNSDKENKGTDEKD